MFNEQDETKKKLYYIIRSSYWVEMKNTQTHKNPKIWVWVCVTRWEQKMLRSC